MYLPQVPLSSQGGASACWQAQQPSDATTWHRSWHPDDLKQRVVMAISPLGASLLGLHVEPLSADVESPEGTFRSMSVQVQLPGAPWIPRPPAPCVL